MTVASSPHALIVPSEGQGHINGAILLAQALSSFGFSTSIAFFSTYYSVLEKKNRLPRLGYPSIRTHVVPDDFEVDKPHDFTAFTPTMRLGLEQLVESLSRHDPVTCLISDTFVPQVQDVADKFGLPRIDYWTSNAMGYLMITNMELLHSNGILPAKGSRSLFKSDVLQMVDCIPGLPPFPVDFYSKHLRFADLTEPFIRLFCSLGGYAKRAERLLIHTVQELEPTALAAFEKVGIPVYPIGPLFQFRTPRIDATPSDAECLKWLDTQADSSVIYVAFGSIASLSPEEIKELASGLEASEQAFLWALRADAVQDRVLSEELPEGFVERTKTRGKIVEWAPQLDVLKHAAVGGFLTHCGWNSTMESIWEGVAILGCPREAEQIANSHYIAKDWKMGIEMERTETGGFDRREVEKGVRRLMQEEEGSGARRRARELQEYARKACEEGGQSRANLQKFYEDMRSRISS